MAMSALAVITSALQSRSDAKRRFRNRRHAGRLLGERLLSLADDDPVVLGIHGGGLPVAAEVAAGLEAPLDVLVVRHIHVRERPTITIGAAAENGVAVLDEEHVVSLQVGADELDDAVARAQAEVREDVARYRGGRSMSELVDRTAVLVDEGLTTGAKARAAIRAARAFGADPVVLAIPVGRAEVIRELAKEADDVVCLRKPEVLWGVAFWYESYEPVPEPAVIAALAGARHL
jgi:putative phosphoribosyl transferase